MKASASGTEKDPQQKSENSFADHSRETLSAEDELAMEETQNPPDAMYVISPVDASQSEELIKEKAIGEKIRKLRLKRSMGLVELGQKTGLSASFLSQLETGRVIPTLRNLSRIAMVFGKDLPYFFEEKKQNCFRKSRMADRIRLPIGAKSSPYLISESMSSLIPDRSLVPCIAEFLPNQRNGNFEPRIFHGQEFVYVLHGSITLSTEHEHQTLEAEDVAWVDGASKRKYFCDGKPAKAIIITCPS